MAYVPFNPIPIQLQNSSSANLSGGTLEFFVAGTTTPTNLYSDNSGTSIGSSITLNAGGYPESGGNVITLFRDTTVTLKVIGKDSGGTTLWTSDQIADPLKTLGSELSTQGASLVGLEDSGGFYSATDVEAALAEVYSESLQNVSEDTTPTLGGALDCNDLEVQKPKLKDLSATVSAPTSSSGALTLDLENGNIFDITLTENVTAITISNWPASGSYGWLKVRFKQDGTGSRTVAGWPAAIGWAGGAAPTITTDATTGRDWIELCTMDAGTQIDGHYGQDYS